ncbi:homeobox-leucine zipper protein ATHB-40-like [Henckelia pumila]|uniref:homeobox-leucine zipper protein ATHB-40-like n=1 Tax=Henckelia pumila TaxID=405737 RepID=UPI003C6E30CA
MALSSQFYSGGMLHHLVQQGNENMKPRRRRREKSKEGGCGGGSVGAARKRKLNEEQVSMLEQNFGSEQKLEAERKERLAAELGLEPRRVAVWFQNKRARWKSKKLEEEFSKLRTEHDMALLEKCRLQAELSKLQEQLNEAEKEIRRLSQRRSGSSSCSPSSWMEACRGGLGMEVLEHMFNYLPNSEYFEGFEWEHLHYM